MILDMGTIVNRIHGATTILSQSIVENVIVCNRYIGSLIDENEMACTGELLVKVEWHRRERVRFASHLTYGFDGSTSHLRIKPKDGCQGFDSSKYLSHGGISSC